MKKIKSNLAVIILLALASGGCFEPVIKNLNAQGSTVVCFGDSITFGYGAGPGEDYPTALAKLLKTPVVNAGVDGDTTFNALERLEKDVLSQEPRLVIVEFCGNDFLKNVPKEDTVKNLAKIIDRIQEKGAMVALVDVSAGMFFKEYRSDFKRLAAKKKAIFISSVLSKIITNPSMKSDFFHPNGRGYQVIAGRIHKSISAYVP